MLARLTGVLEQIEGNTALVGVPGPSGSGGLAPGSMAYEVLLPAFVADAWRTRTGEVVTLHTVQHLEGQAQGANLTPRLIGFASVEERRFFELFTTVKGVGAKRALRALAVPVGEMARAIHEKDAKALKALPEIGPRLAETIIAELHGKVDRFVTSSSSSPGRGGPAGAGLGAGESEAARRATAALVRLGENESQAQGLVRRALELEPELKNADELLAAALAQR